MRNKTTQELADILDVSTVSLVNWIRQGCPCDKSKSRGKSHMFDEAEVAAWMRANNKTGKMGRPVAPETEDIKAAKLRKERAMARNWELTVAEREGQLIDAAAERARDIQKINHIRNRLVGLGATLSPQLEGLNGAERQSLIDSTIEDILRGFGEQ